MNWCATCTVWEHPGGIRHPGHLPPQGRHWTELSARKQKHRPCQKYEAWKKTACLLHFNITTWCYIPLRSWSSVVDSWLSLHDWTAGEPENFSSHLMKDGHDANPWSNEFRKQVLPKFNKPGTIPERKHKSLQVLSYIDLCPTLSYWSLPLFLFFLSVIGPHRT